MCSDERIIIDIDNLIVEDPGELIILGLVGYKGSGKDTVGEYLCKKYGFIRLAFAAPVKKIVAAAFGCDIDDLNDPILKEKIDENWGYTRRELMQKIGTDLFREALPKILPNVTENIWVNRLIIQMKKLYKQDPKKYNKFVITDVRYPNEKEGIKPLGAKILRVNRDKDIYDGKHMSHSSEQYVDKMEVNFDVHNDSTKETLYEKIDEIISEITTNES